MELYNGNKTLHLGLEQTALWELFAIRAGMIKTLNDGNSRLQFNAGAGIKIFGVYLDGAFLGLENGDKAGIEVSAGFRY